jgi:hypothetical protein
VSVERLLQVALESEDPLERARILNNEVLPAVADLRQSIIKERALSVKEACDFGNGGDGFTYSEVANAMTVSKPLVQQMVALAREIHTLRMVSSTNGSIR